MLEVPPKPKLHLCEFNICTLAVATFLVGQSSEESDNDAPEEVAAFVFGLSLLISIVRAFGAIHGCELTLRDRRRV